MRRFSQWLAQKWSRREDPTLAQAYRATFGSFDGQRVLRHLVDNVYATIYEGRDPIEMAIHNGRRSMVHEILETLDMAEQPEKYQVRMETEEK